jgi:eukaryotic-like serine/threonine-protein kinase
MGVVYRARDERLQRDVAIKVLPPGLLSDEPAKSRFRKEALALARLSHPNIAAVFDVGEQDGMNYLVMECVPGQTLSQKMRSQQLPAKEILSLGVQVAGALEEAHEQGVVHRDLKPSNIMVTPKGHAKVLDFGLAKLLEPVGTPEVTLSLVSRHPWPGWNCALHVSRAGRGQTCRQSHRSLEFWRGALRSARR